jgi:hypothetical protein
MQNLVFASGFIALKHLFLNKMPKLISLLGVQVGENMFTSLSKLTIIVCPNLLAFPFLPASSQGAICIASECLIVIYFYYSVNEH